jgi:multidrug efflux pump subunit AcrB
MSISEWYIRRPIATSLLMLGLLVLGSTAYKLLPVAALPDADFPTISVFANLPGASPETMATSVATPLELQFSAIPGLVAMTSWSGLGNTSITLQFTLDRSIDGAATDVQTAINSAGGLLPRDLPNPPTYRKVNPSDRAVLIYAVYSDDLPMYKVDDFAYTVLAQQIQSVSGVGQVIIAGQQDFAVRVRANPAALAAHGIGLEEVAPPSPPPPPTRPRARSRAASSRSRSTPTTSCSARRATATSSLPSATARRSRSATSPTWSTAPACRAPAPGTTARRPRCC